MSHRHSHCLSSHLEGRQACSLPAVVRRGQPVAAAVVEFAGGPYAWVTRTFTACEGEGAFCNGHRISVSDVEDVTRSLLVGTFLTAPMGQQLHRRVKQICARAYHSRSSASCWITMRSRLRLGELPIVNPHNDKQYVDSLAAVGLTDRGLSRR